MMFDETNGFENENKNENENISGAENTNEVSSGSLPSEQASAENASNAEGVEESVPCRADNLQAAAEEIAEETNEETADKAQDASEESLADTAVVNVDEPAKPASSDFGGGAFYSTNSEGVPANGYEWDARSTEQEKKPSKAKRDSSGRGFKVFIAATLSVFTLSVVALTVLVASYAFGDGKPTTTKESNGTKITQSSENYDYSNVTIDNPNFVAFDFKEYDGKVLSIPEIAAKCTPSSVGIISEIETTYNYPFYFSPTTRVAEASGSGFIYSADGYIITNHHVIENATKITVVLYDGSEYEATLVGSDDLSDIAVLKITPSEETKLIPMEIGNSDELVVGEPVVAIGCPAGVEFIGTVTDGIISAINRNVELTDSYGATEKTMTLIQTNATINHGNSGGPLINSKGQVIGINTLKLASDYEGIGFSIPMNGASPIISQLIEHGKVVERTEEDFAYGKGMIGINGTEISDDESEYYGIPKGVLVVQIDRDSSASKAGLRRGDIITHYNGTAISSVDEINSLKGSARAGTEVTLTVYRDGDSGKGETIDIVFKLDPQK